MTLSQRQEIRIEPEKYLFGMARLRQRGSALTPPRTSSGRECKGNGVAPNEGAALWHLMWWQPDWLILLRWAGVRMRRPRRWMPIWWASRSHCPGGAGALSEAQVEAWVSGQFSVVASIAATSRVLLRSTPARPLTAPTERIIDQPVQPRLDETPPPFAHGYRIHPQICGDPCAHSLRLRTRQHDPRPSSQPKSLYAHCTSRSRSTPDRTNPAFGRPARTTRPR